MLLQLYYWGRSYQVQGWGTSSIPLQLQQLWVSCPRLTLLAFLFLSDFVWSAFYATPSLYYNLFLFIKQPGQKSVMKKMKKNNMKFCTFATYFELTPTWLLATFWYLCVHSVEDSTLILIFDPFCLSLFLKGSPKFSPNRYT